MKTPKTPRSTPAKPPRNPHARALRAGPYKPKVVKGKDVYRRKPKHPKPEPGDDREP